MYQIKSQDNTVRNLIGIGLIFLIFFGYPLLLNYLYPPKPKPAPPQAEQLDPLQQRVLQMGLPRVSAVLAAVPTISGAGVAEAVRLTTALATTYPQPRLTAGQFATLRQGLIAFGGLPSGQAAAADAVPLSVALLATQRSLTQPKPREIPPEEKPQLLVLGDDPANPFHLRVVFNSRGAAIQQVVLNQFKHANRLGLAVQDDQGKTVPLHLIPGTIQPRPVKMRSNEPPPTTLNAGPLPAGLSTPSFVLYHYPTAKELENEPEAERQVTRPLDLLGKRVWKVVANAPATDSPDVQSISFETTLEEPHNVKITKTYTLHRREYHIGLTVRLERLPQAKSAGKFRYQISGAVGTPIEGEWYTATFRNAVVGFIEKNGYLRRFLDDARTISYKAGSDKFPRTENTLEYAGILLQYFASVLVVDDQQPQGGKRNFLEYARATPEGSLDPKRPFSDDITMRVVTEELDLNEPVEHRYLLYQGPVKVRLLHRLKDAQGNDAVAYDTVERYERTLRLNTLTDYQMPGPIGSFAYAIWWTDLVIFFTNLIHGLLGVLNTFLPNLAWCVLCVTLIVRGAMFPLTRKQTLLSLKFQEQMARLAPEMKKLNEKYKDDFFALNEARQKLFKQHGINPLAPLGGCLPLLLQMPIFMGLYFALQESIFFRLESFLWMPNLAAPDMLFWWSESIPIFSDPEWLGSGFYLGPYFNLLPIIAVTLMLIQQKLMMPPPTDEQQEFQQKMMKFMMIVIGFVFYKVAAGLCLYFIASTAWGLIERQFIPKPRKPGELPPEEPSRPATATPPTAAKPSQERAAAAGKKKGKAKKGRILDKPTDQGSPIGFLDRLKDWLEKKLDEDKKKP